MATSNPVMMLVTYTPKMGCEAELVDLLKKHWSTLRRLDLVTPAPGKLWRASDKDSGRVRFLEMFEWADATSSDIAHQTPDVMAVWEPMGPLLESMSFQRLQQL